LKRKRDEAREGAPYLIKLNEKFISFYNIIDKFLAKNENSTPNVATDHPHSRFKIYDMVYSTPANTPGCDSSQSIALYGSVIALKFEDELMVKIKSSNDGRNQLWVPETRVNSTSKSIIDNSIIYLGNSSVIKKLQTEFLGSHPKAE
jgi:hypothetical protein